MSDVYEYRASAFVWSDLCQDFHSRARQWIVANNIPHGWDHDFNYLWMRITDEQWFLLKLTHQDIAKIFRKQNGKT